MSLQSIIPQLERKIKQHPDFRGQVTFDCGADGSIHVDTTQKPAVLVCETRSAVLTLTLSVSTLEGFMNGTQDPNVAYLTGKLKIKGPIGLAMRLNALLEG